MNYETERNKVIKEYLRNSLLKLIEQPCKCEITEIHFYKGKVKGHTRLRCKRCELMSKIVHFLEKQRPEFSDEELIKRFEEWDEKREIKKTLGIE